MMTFVPKTHSDYPKRIECNNKLYNEYKKERKIFFHQVLLNIQSSPWSETLVPTTELFENRWSYILNDYILNSLHFEFCTYQIK